MRLKEIKEEIEWMLNFQGEAKRLMAWALPLLQEFLGDQETPRQFDKDMLSDFEEFLSD